MKRWICFIGVFALFSCGRGKFPDYNPKETNVKISVEHQYYKAKFNALNGRRSTLKRAEALLWLKLRQFYVKIIFWGFSKRRYYQFIHAGHECPDMKSDFNFDGLIDFYETVLSSGEIIISLDGNLQTGPAGSDWYPRSGNNGSYLYTRSSSLLNMLPDLGYSSVDELDLSNRVIVIYEINSGPMIPIACATISSDQ